MHNEYTHSDWIASIAYTKEYLCGDVVNMDEQTEKHFFKSYSPYLINMQLASKVENLMLIQMANNMPKLDKKMQYDFLFHSIKKTNPNAAKQSWNKSVSKKKKFNVVQFNIIKEYYGYNNQKAQTALKILTPDQVYQMAYWMNKSKGGKN